MTGQVWLRLWSFFAFLADLLVLIAGGVSVNPFLAWAGLAGLSGQGLTALFGKRIQAYTRLILLSSALSMTASGLNLFDFNDVIHPGQVAFGVMCTAALVLVFWPVKIILLGNEMPSAKLASLLFLVTATFLLGDGISHSSWLIVSAAACYVVGDVCCYMIPPPKLITSHET